MGKRKKASVKIYYIVSIFCLVVLFIGYNFFSDLADKRKKEQEIKTISLIDENGEIVERYNRVFAKIMSYFNIFFKETYDDYEENGLFNKPIKKHVATLNTSLVTVQSDEPITLDNIDIYRYTENLNNEFSKKILLADDRKDNFFVFNGGLNLASNIGYSSKDIKEKSRKFNEKYSVVIYHSHATEAYNNCPKTNFRSSKDNENVVAIGANISKNLNNNGITVLHLKNHNDVPSYSKSYPNSRKLVADYLKKDKNNIIIDIHRDGADAESNYEKLLANVTRIKINDTQMATFSIVVGSANKNVDKLKKFANYIKKKSDELYPNLCRGIIVRNGGRYNQDTSDYAILLEIGCHLNTFEEAKRTSEYLSEVLCKAFCELE